MVTNVAVLVSVLCVIAFATAAAEPVEHLLTVSGEKDAVPPNYASPLVSNGSLCLQIDYQGGQFQLDHSGMKPAIFWAGRRYGPPHDELISFGHFEQELVIAGKAFTVPSTWTQTLDTKEATVTCRNNYEALTVETVVFTPLSHNLIVVKKRLIARSPEVRAARMAITYCFTPPGNENQVPRRTVSTCAWNEAAQSAEFRYHVDGHRPCDGIISLFCDRPATATIDRQTATLTTELQLDPATPAEATFYLFFADSMDGKDYPERAAKTRTTARQDGFAGLLAVHRNEWARHWEESYVHLPDPRLGQVYCTAQYHLRSNATRWSFPVGIFNTHWAGRYFGWDETFCYQALASSNHLAVSRRAPEFRFACLEKAVQRNSHYGRPGVYGARYPWETLEDGSEGSPPGFWMEHIFHMSNIALAAWSQYQYSEDGEYLQKTGYPVIRECARFFFANMVYETADGGAFIGKCTDLERLGPARPNPFMTSCGAIYTLEAAAQAAETLKTDTGESVAWKRVAAKLRESLPRDGDRYVPYPDCKEESIAVLGGLFPYPVLDGTDAMQKNAAYRFITKGRAGGNMYPVGNSVCGWYAGWMAAALATLGDTVEPGKLLSEAAGGAGCFGELFEINEAKVSMRPWFATASGNFVYALNQMLLQCRSGEIRIAAGVPERWRNYAFKLACYGDLVAEAVVKEGRLVKLVLTPGRTDTEYRRVLVVPTRLVNEAALQKAIVQSVTQKDSVLHIDVRFKGKAEIVREP